MTDTKKTGFVNIFIAYCCPVWNNLKFLICHTLKLHRKTTKNETKNLTLGDGFLWTKNKHIVLTPTCLSAPLISKSMNQSLAFAASGVQFGCKKANSFLLQSEVHLGLCLHVMGPGKEGDTSHPIFRWPIFIQDFSYLHRSYRTPETIILRAVKPMLVKIKHLQWPNNLTQAKINNKTINTAS